LVGGITAAFSLETEYSFMVAPTILIMSGYHLLVTEIAITVPFHNKP
jgi:hypothetical protein